MLNPKPLLIAAAVSGVLLAGYGLGSWKTSLIYEDRLATQQTGHERDMRLIAEAKANELGHALAEQQRLTDQAHQLGWELIQTRSRLADTQFQLKQRIPDATRSDGPRFTGLGPDSLRLYRAALGYRESDPGVPPTNAGNVGEADQTASTDEGLPPEDLLAHSADYGQWCQQLDAQLDTLINLHRKDTDGPI